MREAAIRHISNEIAPGNLTLHPDQRHDGRSHGVWVGADPPKLDHLPTDITAWLAIAGSLAAS